MGTSALHRLVRRKPVEVRGGHETFRFQGPPALLDTAHACALQLLQRWSWNRPRRVRRYSDDPDSSRAPQNPGRREYAPNPAWSAKMNALPWRLGVLALLASWRPWREPKVVAVRPTPAAAAARGACAEQSRRGLDPPTAGRRLRVAAGSADYPCQGARHEPDARATKS